MLTKLMQRFFVSLQIGWINKFLIEILHNVKYLRIKLRCFKLMITQNNVFISNLTWYQNTFFVCN